MQDLTTIAQQLDHIDQRLQSIEYFADLKITDTYCLGLLQNLLNGYPLIPFTGASLRPLCLVHIVNDILINDRQNIMEFGSGISTIMVGRLIKKNNLPSKIMSIEHDLSWSLKIEKLLTAERLDEIVKVVHIPLKPCPFSLDQNCDWYDIDQLALTSNNEKYDMLIVDGPPAWEEIKKNARYPALPFMIDKFNPNFSIYLDDANREGEQSIIRLWENEYHIEFKVTGNTLAYSQNGQSFYTEVLGY